MISDKIPVADLLAEFQNVRGRAEERMQFLFEQESKLTSQKAACIKDINLQLKLLHKEMDALDVLLGME
jgi:hypothetical protein